MSPIDSVISVVAPIICAAIVIERMCHHTFVESIIDRKFTIGFVTSLSAFILNVSSFQTFTACVLSIIGMFMSTVLMINELCYKKAHADDNTAKTQDGVIPISTTDVASELRQPPAHAQSTSNHPTQ
jgi:hypothetical protein